MKLAEITSDAVLPSSRQRTTQKSYTVTKILLDSVGTALIILVQLQSTVNLGISGQCLLQGIPNFSSGTLGIVCVCVNFFYTRRRRWVNFEGASPRSVCRDAFTGTACFFG